MLKCHLLSAALLGLLAFGAWNVGHGAYIYAKAALAQHLLRQAWEDTRQGQVAVKPWSWADTYPVARLSMPQLNVDQIVLAGASGRTMAFGPGHVDGTPLPGSAGNSVLTAHRDTHFAFLQQVQLGDTFSVENAQGKTTHYVVQATRVVDQSEVGVMRPSVEEQLTLITCYPFNAVRPGGPLRYVVTALPREEQKIAQGRIEQADARTAAFVPGFSLR